MHLLDMQVLNHRQADSFIKYEFILFFIINHSYKIGIFLFLFITSIKVIC